MGHRHFIIIINYPQRVIPPKNLKYSYTYYWTEQFLFILCTYARVWIYIYFDQKSSHMIKRIFGGSPIVSSKY